MSDACVFYALPRGLAVGALAARLEDELGLVRTGRLDVLRTWYDSFDWRLFAAGLALEHDLEGSEGHLRLRPRGTARTIAAARVASVPRYAIGLPPGSLRRKVSAAVKIRALLPMAQARVRARTFERVDAAGKVMLRLAIEQAQRTDTGGARPRPLVRIEVLRGYADALPPVAAFLHQRCALQPLDADPLFVLLESGRGRLPLDYTSKPLVVLTPEIAAGPAVGAVLASYFDVIRGNEPGIRADIDTEFLHEFRTAMRRSRSLLLSVRGVVPTLERTHFKTTFAWLSRLTGGLRDLDVFELALPGHLDRLPASLRPEGERVRAFLAERRRHEMTRVLHGMDTERYRAFDREWQELLDGLQAGTVAGQTAHVRAREVARRAIARLLERLLHQGTAALAAGTIAGQHELRKTAKKLRYVIEAFATLFAPEDTAAAVRGMKRLQDNLGSICDASVQQALLAQWRASMQSDPATTRGMIEIMRRIEAHVVRDATDPQEKFALTYARFSRPRNLRRLRRLVQP
ncbi:MAG: CHAD domain-containing protein [Gammaproteobacteria bacterium]|nr:CHAD domain-containing protein [Gammaproteobacteria bacterium]